MKKGISTGLVALLLSASAAFASDLNLGVKLYRDGLYSLAAKTFKENMETLEGKEFTKFYRVAYLSFLKARDYAALKKLVDFWQSRYPNFHRGELLALQTVLALKNGIPIGKAFPAKELQSLPISEKVGFFYALSQADLPPEAVYYLLKVASKSVDLKGAVKESGFLKSALERATKSNDYTLIDLIFDNYGRWFSSPEATLQFIRYLERKGRFVDALVEAQKLYKRYPNQRTRLELARAYYLNGKYDRVLKLLKNPSTPQERYLIAWTYFKMGKARLIPSVIGMDVSKPAVPQRLKVLENFYAGYFNLPELKKFYPDLYVKALIFSFSTAPLEGSVGSPHDRGYYLYERGRFSEASKALEEALQSAANSYLTPRSLYLLGRVGTVNTSVGNVVYTQLMNSYQNTPYYRESVVPAAKVYLLSGNPALAVKLLDYARRELGYDTDRVKELEAKAFVQLGDYKRAVKLLGDCRHLSGEGYTLLAFSLYQLGKGKEALSVLRKELKSSGLFPEVNGGRALFVARAVRAKDPLKGIRVNSPVVEAMEAVAFGNVKLAEQVYQRLPQRERLALALFLARYYENRDPKKAFFYIAELMNLASTDDVESFAKHYLNYLAYKTGDFTPVLFNDPYFIAYNPENAVTSISTLVAKAEDYASAGQFGKAYGLLKLALERTTSPDLRREIVYRLVELDLKQKNYSRALKDASLLPEESQKDRDLKNYLLFRTYLAMGRLVDAYSAAQKVKDVDNLPEGVRASFLAKLARYYKLTGNKERAVELTRELIERFGLKGVDYDDLVSLAILAQESGKLDLAKKLILQARKKAVKPEQVVESTFWKAAIEAQQGDIDDAIIDYLKIAYDYSKYEPWASTALYRAAQLFEQKGDYRQALKLYEKVAKLKRGTKEGEIAAKKVKSLLQRLNEEE
ncbi:tetratricopeptide repeat protein [Thermovibrio ammonificans]